MLSFSIIIPVKSINDYVRETVPFIQALDYGNWELFIVTNELESNEWSDDKRITIIESGRVGPADKRDIAAKKTSKDILVFLDDDSYPESNILNLAIQYFKDPEVIALGGPGITPPTDDFWQKVSGAVFLSKFTGGAPERYVSYGEVREVDDWPSVNLMVSRKHFLKVGGFDCNYWPGEDTKLCFKLKGEGMKIVYVPNMIVWHHRRAGLISHLKQVGAYGLHRGYFANHYPDTSFRLKYFFPSIFFIFTLITFWKYWMPEALSNIIIFGWVCYSLILIKSAIDFLKFEKMNIVIFALFYVPLTHFYYGLNFIVGYFKKGKLVSVLR
jgi:GT2 family glycosyltransferase